MDAVDLFIDYWILYRTQEPTVPVLNGKQVDFELALRKLINEEKSKLIDDLQKEWSKVVQQL